MLLAEDLRHYLARHYQGDGITDGEMASILQQLQSLPASDLYQSNKTFCQWLGNGFLLKRENREQKDLYIELLDTRELPEQLARLFSGEEQAADIGNNIFRLVNQLEIEGRSVNSKNGDGERNCASPMPSSTSMACRWWCSSLNRRYAKRPPPPYDAWRQLCVRASAISPSCLSITPCASSVMG